MQSNIDIFVLFACLIYKLQIILQIKIIHTGILINLGKKVTVMNLFEHLKMFKQFSKC